MTSNQAATIALASMAVARLPFGTMPPQLREAEEATALDRGQQHHRLRLARGNRRCHGHSGTDHVVGRAVIAARSQRLLAAAAYRRREAAAAPSFHRDPPAPRVGPTPKERTFVQ